VVHFRGRTGPFLEPAPGTASFNILRLARPELHLDLRRAIHQALTDNSRVGINANLNDNGRPRPFKLEVIPMTDPETTARWLIVLFHEPEEPPPSLGPAPAEKKEEEARSPGEQRINELERELLVTKEYLQSTIEELESANEELKSSNEELQSSNEELQSTNEELETSKEELQSSNEELTTVNDELQTRMNELQLTNDDLHNVLACVDSAVVIVGMDHRIRRFTHVAEKLFNLVPGDVGRSVSQLNAFTGERLETICAEVVQMLSVFQKEVQGTDQRWYAMRVSPYKTLEHSITGSVVVVTDIDARKRVAQVGQEVASYASTFLEVIPRPLMIIDAKLRLVWANPAFYTRFTVAPEDLIGTDLSTVQEGAWADPKLLALIESTATTGAAFRSFRVAREFPKVGKLSFQISGSRIAPTTREAGLILLAFDEGDRAN
jgi:two-component system CheB/CheR fusion protein